MDDLLGSLTWINPCVHLVVRCATNAVNDVPLSLSIMDFLDYLLAPRVVKVSHVAEFWWDEVGEVAWPPVDVPGKGARANTLTLVSPCVHIVDPLESPALYANGLYHTLITYFGHRCPDIFE